MPARVLLTGGAGLIGTQLREGLTDYQVRVSDRDLSSVELRDNEEAAVAELGDFEAVRKAVDGCDYIVHLAADPRVHAPWKDLRVPNFDGVYNVFEAAKQPGTRRIVFASTNHVTGLHDLNQRWPTRPDGDVAPDSLYGASKAFGEALGRFYSETSGLSVLCLRIGWVNHYQRPNDPDWLRMWLSFRDLRQLVRKSLAAPEEIRFGIYYGVSNNTPMRYDLTNARRDLGYAPEDDSATIPRADSSAAG